ncbi:nitrite reductase small subunit NirD [Pseudoalteromonas sp. MMG010]|uniref:nitrite reductase small subunit NirD n=1 Tax=Pseudoalteromonas sp. MMG010 TaxID=2822685 RepID=UPI001B3A4E6D|nr:nitrite reductase small subunit NirD [Pseudoalteromonas sp. MMG010]MBQ4832548.1 nitrite reductase small subunit NirD [Pseudoalteromonas sp. MMG010]
MSWHNIGSLNDLVKNSGVCALVNEQQIAVFFIPDTPNEVYAIGNYDPIGKANVLSRGIVGSQGEKLVVASPLYKQHFCLDTGECLQDTAMSVPSYSTKIEQGCVFIHSQPNLVTSVA